MINQDLFNKIINNAKNTPKIDMYIYQNKDTILKALTLNVSIQSIYNTVINECGINVSYKTFYNKVKKLKDNISQSAISTTDLNFNEMINKNTLTADETLTSLTSITETHQLNDTKIEHNKNDEQKPLSKNKQKLEALRKKLEETNGIVDGNKLKANQFVWTPTRRE